MKVVFNAQEVSEALVYYMINQKKISLGNLSKIDTTTIWGMSNNPDNNTITLDIKQL